MKLCRLHDHTILFRVRDFIFVTYGLIAAAAFVVALGAALWYAACAGHDPSTMAAYSALAMFPAVLLGARAASVLLDWRQFRARPWATLLRPGYVLHGGVFGGAAALIAYAAATGDPLLSLFDAWGFAMPLGEAVCRLGCYVYGCCWGRPTSGRLGVAYHSPHAKVVRLAPHLRGVRLHPTQLYASFGSLALFAGLVALLPLRRGPGIVAGVYLVAHAGFRTLLERFRHDFRGQLWHGMTHTNLYSVLLAAAGAVYIAVGARAAELGPPAWGAVTLTDVLLRPVPLACLVLVWVGAAAAFGVHVGQVGSWLGARARTSDGAAAASAGHPSGAARPSNVEKAA